MVSREVGWDEENVGVATACVRAQGRKGGARVVYACAYLCVVACVCVHSMCLAMASWCGAVSGRRVAKPRYGDTGS